MELSTKLYILGDDGSKFLGAGVLWLLESVEEKGSLLSAAKSMGLSYTKARAMLDNLERNLGCPVLDRRKGGAERSGATLTPFAHRLISLYRGFQDDVKAEADRRFSSFLLSLDKLMEEENEQRTI